MRRTVGQPLEVAYEGLTGDKDPAHQARFREAFSSVARPMQANGVPLFPGAEALLRALHAAGVHVAVASTKQRHTLEKILGAHGLMEVLDFVIGGDCVANMKPAPDCVLLGLERLGLTPEEYHHRRGHCPGRRVRFCRCAQRYHSRRGLRRLPQRLYRP